MKNSREVEALVRAELTKISDQEVLEALTPLLVLPYRVDRKWDYGPDGQTHPCWTVLEHRESNTGIAYCENGFGPKVPWGLVFLSGDYMSIGMDCNWFPSLEDAFRDSMAWDE